MEENANHSELVHLFVSASPQASPFTSIPMFNVLSSGLVF